MYRLSLQRDFEARHYLIGGDWGVENVEHAHPYRVEWILEGPSLDEHGYLVDLVEIEEHLEAILRSYRARVLNDLPEFAGLNPSLEHFARILAGRLGAALVGKHLTVHLVRLWESETAWASFRQEL